MTPRLRLLSRVALFAALVYVFSWATSYLPNINLAFFIVFSGGFLFGAVPGALVGIIGMGLFSAFNPYGPAHFYVMVVQMLGMSISGVVGAGVRRADWEQWSGSGRVFGLILASIVCTAAYFIPVSAVDAWLFQPFWPRFWTGALWSLWSLVANAAIFPLLFGVTRHLYTRTDNRQWLNT